MSNVNERRWALDYVTDNTNIVKAIKTDAAWEVMVSPVQISSSWDNNDVVTVNKTINAERNADGSIKMCFEVLSYHSGDLLTVLFHNETKDEYEPIYINMSDSYNYEFTSQYLANKFCSTGKIVSDNVQILAQKDNINTVDVCLPKHIKPSDIVAEISEHEVGNDSMSAQNRTYSSTTTAATNFIIYNASGYVANEYSGFSTKSPFRAIQKIVKDNKINYTVRESNGNHTIVFKYMPSMKNTFYLFQNTNYYGSTESVSEVEDWCRGYVNSHTVRCDGYFASNKTAINQHATNQPYSHYYEYICNDPSNVNISLLEGNTGAYVYKVAKPGSYTKATAIINLSEARLHYSDTENVTFYSYINATNKTGDWFSCDIGLAMSKDASGNMLLTVNATGNCDIERSHNEFTTVVDFYKNGSDYISNQDVKLYFEVYDGYYKAKLFNYQKNTTYSITVYNSNIHRNGTIFLNGTSLVPNSTRNNQHIIPDIECGAYAKNIPILYSRLYTSNQNPDYDGTEFDPENNAVTDTTLMYDKHHVNYEYNRSLRREVIDIDYTHKYIK